MKVIMNNIESYDDVVDSYTIVKQAVKDGINQGRNNYMFYGIIRLPVL